MSPVTTLYQADPDRHPLLRANEDLWALLHVLPDSAMLEALLDWIERQP